MKPASGLPAAILSLPIALMSLPAAAVDRTFEFFQTGSTPAGSVVAHGLLTVSDAAFQTGLNVDLDEVNSDFSGTGIVSIGFDTTFFVTGFGPVPLLGNFVAGDPILGPIWNISLVSSPGRVPTGVVAFSDTANSFDFFLGNPQSNGVFATDLPPALSVCHFGCGFSGRWEPVGFVVVAPEPATLGLFATCVATLIATRRRWRVAGTPALRTLGARLTFGLINLSRDTGGSAGAWTKNH